LCDDDVIKTVDVALGPCTRNYGGCSHFCWTTSANTKVCDCAAGFFLAFDGKKCIVRKYHKTQLFYYNST